MAQSMTALALPYADLPPRSQLGAEAALCSQQLVESSGTSLNGNEFPQGL